MYRAHSKRGNGLFRDALYHTQRFGHNVDRFFRTHGNKIRDVAMMVAPLLAPENPALASAVGVVGQGAASYSQFRDRLDQAS